MTAQLALFRARLADLQRRRRALRRSTRAAAGGLVLLGVLLIAFLADWQTEMGRAGRLVVWGVGCALGVTAVRRGLVPLASSQESEIDLALRIERRHRIDSDIVAAIEFERLNTHAWGSAQLKSAVIEHVARASDAWDLRQFLPLRPLVQRGGILLVALALVATASAMAPNHVRVFWNRMFLWRNAHYPTRTMLVSLSIGGQTVQLSAGEGRVRLPWGQAADIEARCRGETPTQGVADLRSQAGLVTTATLVRGEADVEWVEYHGRLPQLVEPAHLTLRVGDCWTEPIAVELVEPPVAELEFEVRPPDYTGLAQSEVFRGVRHLAVLEGSSVLVRLLCRNKPLRSATLLIDGQPDSGWPLERTSVVPGMQRAASPSPSLPGEVWSGGAPPLAPLRAPAMLRITAVDEDGLVPEVPLFCSVQATLDQPPRVAGVLVAHDVLPEAQPTLDFTASDDFGLATLRLRIEVIHADASAGPSWPAQEITSFESPYRGPEPLRGKYTLPLAPLGLRPGDQLRLTLEAIDYRGAAPGESTLSEPLLAQVVDEATLTARVLEADHRTLRQLDAVSDRERQLKAAP